MDLDDDDDVKEKCNENEVLDSESKQGELIVDLDDNIVKVGEDDADWSVVRSIGDTKTTESEQIGKAAEMLGSALFNSDMKNSAEDKGSNLIGSDSSFSIPSSVPTDVTMSHGQGTGPSPVSRWAAELKKLHELGFDNEESCIEVLERIGSDESTLSSNIDRAVDELLSFPIVKC